MKSTFGKLFFICLLLVLQISTKAQFLDKVERSVGFYYQNNYQEKIFIHTDKEQYLAGELLWLKLYVVGSSNFIPTSVSKLAYVEILDLKNEVVLQAKIELREGNGDGSLIIPSAIKNGKYKLRAYTNWMQNYGPTTFFEKQITIYNVQSFPVKTTNAFNTPDIKFFPEGGDLISGISNNVGFKVVSPQGKGVDVHGYIINKKNDTVTKFKSLKFGIGKFTITPLQNDSYKVVFISKKEGVLIKNLPEARAQGYAIDLVEDVNVLTLNLNTNMKDDWVYLFIHNAGVTSFAERGNVENGKVSFSINKTMVNDGISHLTIFNQDGQAVCERLYFKKLTQKLKIQTSLKSQYEIRKKITIDLSLTNKQGLPVDGSLSIAVRKLDSLYEMDENNIESYFWLSSELKGYIESPSYYLDNNNAEVDRALDNLVMTQGWRRFNWAEVLNERAPQFKFVPEVNGHLISGKIADKSGVAIKYRKLFLSVPDKRFQFYEGESDTTGHFLFNTKDFFGRNEMVVQTDLKDTTSVIEIASPFSNLYTPVETIDFNINPSLINELQASNLSVQVQNTYAGNRLKSFRIPIIDSVSFYGKPYKSYKFSDFTRFTTMEETLRSFVAETFVRINQKSYNIRLLGKDYALDDDPLVLLDGIPYFSMNKVMGIDPNKIEKLEIIPENYYYGSSQYAGILSFFSYKNNLANTEINPNAVVLDYEGLQLHREFSSPTYDTPSKTASRIPDFRNLLYWAPEIPLDAHGKAQLNFYTSDVSGIYIGIINGLSKNGMLGSSSFIFEVK